MLAYANTHAVLEERRRKAREAGPSVRPAVPRFCRHRSLSRRGVTRLPRAAKGDGARDGPIAGQVR